MGTVITVMNMKGGVGKTTVAMHLGGIFALYKIPDERRRVLLIHYDPQFNLSQALLPATTYFPLEKARKTTLAILQDEETDLDPYVLQVPGNHTPPSAKKLTASIYSKHGVLDLVPSTLDLMYVALGHSEARVRPIEERFDKFIAQCRREYDLIIIDCHPAGSILTKTSLRNSDHVVIPVVPQSFAVRGIGLMFEFIKAATPSGTPAIPHVLFNKTHRSLVSPVEHEIRANKDTQDYCMQNTLKKYKAFSEPCEGRNLVWQSKKSWSNKAFANLLEVTQELGNRIARSKPK